MSNTANTDNAITTINHYWKAECSLTDVHDAIRNAPYTPATKTAITKALKMITLYRNDPNVFPDMLEAFDNVARILERQYH